MPSWISSTTSAPCTSGPTCDPDTGYNDLNQPVLGSDGVADGFPNPSRIYKSMELVVGRRFGTGMQLYASYVLSRLTGNFQGSFRGDNGQTDPNISSLFDFTNSDGLLSGQYIPGPLPRIVLTRSSSTPITPGRT